MTSTDVVIPLAAGVAVVCGLVVGARVAERHVPAIRRAALCSALIFAATIIIAAVVARSAGDAWRVVIFWLAAVSLVLPLFGLGTSLSLLFRRPLRHQGRVLGFVSLLPAFTFVAVVVVRKLVTG